MVFPDQTVQKKAAESVSGKNDGTSGYFSRNHFADTDNITALNGRVHALAGHFAFKNQIARENILKECGHATTMGRRRLRSIVCGFLWWVPVKIECILCDHCQMFDELVKNCKTCRCNTLNQQVTSLPRQLSWLFTKLTNI